MIDRILDKYNRHIGLLLLRLGFGGMYAVAHGWGKIAGGVERWEKVGGAMKYVGIDLAPAFWGLAAGCSEFFGGILIAIGLLFRPAATAVLLTMIVAVSMHLGSGDGFMKASHAIENGIVLLGLLLIGPGKYSLDRVILNKFEKAEKVQL